METAQEVTTKRANERYDSSSQESEEADPAVMQAVKQMIDDQALEQIVRKMISATIELAAAFELKYDKEKLQRNQVRIIKSPMVTEFYLNNKGTSRRDQAIRGDSIWRCRLQENVHQLP